MSYIAIRVKNLSKLYTIGRAQQRHDTLRDSIADFRLKIQGSLRPRHLQSSISNLQSPEDLWALRDVSFEACPEPGRRIKQGEVVGVIGRNGAGKSALPSTRLRARLKILSRITEPTSGRAETCADPRRSIHGRVGSLLDASRGHRLPPRSFDSA